MRRLSETRIQTTYYHGMLVTEKITSRVLKQILVEELQGTGVVTHVSGEAFKFSVLGMKYIRRYDDPTSICTSVDGKRAFDMSNVEFEQDTKILPSLYTKMMNDSQSRAYWLKLK